ncbi:MAG TPA: hypothetical protein DCQ17_04110 [Firmicutes bacterium]|nr:hypothetical protein [Bacillota bacterium]
MTVEHSAGPDSRRSQRRQEQRRPPSGKGLGSTQFKPRGLEALAQGRKELERTLPASILFHKGAHIQHPDISLPHGPHIAIEDALVGEHPHLPGADAVQPHHPVRLSFHTGHGEFH